MCAIARASSCVFRVAGWSMVIFRFNGVKRLNPLQGIWQLLADKLIRVANICQHAGDFSTLGPISHSSFSHGQNSIFAEKNIPGSTGEIHESWLKSQNFQVNLWNYHFCWKKPIIFAASVHREIGGRQPRRLSQCLGGFLIPILNPKIRSFWNKVINVYWESLYIIIGFIYSTHYVGIPHRWMTINAITHFGHGTYGTVKANDHQPVDGMANGVTTRCL